MILLVCLFICYILFFFSPLQKKIMKRYRFLHTLHYIVNAENLHQLSTTVVTEHFETLLVEFNAETRRVSLYRAFCKQLTLNVFHKYRAQASSEQQFQEQLQILHELFATHDTTSELFTNLVTAHFPAPTYPLEKPQISIY